MKARTFYFILWFVGIISTSFLSTSPDIAQIPLKMQQQKDTTKRKDPINRMTDSAHLRQAMRDSNMMKTPPQSPMDSMPTKDGWINSDSLKKKNTKI